MRSIAIVGVSILSFILCDIALAINVPGDLRDSQRDPPPSYGGLFDGAPSLSEAVRLEGVGGYVEGVSQRAFERLISREGTDWICDSVTEAINRRRRGEGGGSIFAIFSQDEALKEAVRTELKKRVREKLPGMIRHVIVENVLVGAVGEEHVREAEALAERVVAELNTSMNDRVDAVVDSMYSSTLRKLNELVGPQPIIGAMDITDLRGTIARAFNLGNIAGAAASALGNVVGDATVSGIRGRITDALNGQLPPELVDALEAGPEAFDEYIARARRYLPGEALDRLTNSVLNRPIIKLPTPAYVTILSASAAGHFSRAFRGPFVDPLELKRGTEVIRVMVWQMRNKESINLSLMQMGSVARQIASNFGAGEAFNDIAGRLSAPLDRLQEMADRIDEFVMGPIEEVRGELRDIVDGITGELTGIQEYFVSPVRDGLGIIQGGLGGIRDSIIDTLPDGFNGIPSTWEDMKDQLGIEGGILGEGGDLRPVDMLRDVSERLGLDEAAEKVRRDFSELNERLSEHIANGAAGALEALHLLGPTAAIMDVERVPAKNPPLSEELDPVLLHNGEYILEVTDVVIPGRGIDFRFTRTYRGRSDFTGELGWRWTHSYAERILPWKDGYTHVDSQGRKFFFRRNGNSYESPPGIYSKLKNTSGGFELRYRNGNITSFDAKGRIIERRDRYDNRMTFEYGEGGLLATVIDTYGRRIHIERRTDGLIEKITDLADRKFTFEYNEGNELIGVTSPATRSFRKGKTTAYRYAGDAKDPARKHLLTMIMDPNGKVFLRNRYDSEGRVVGQRYGEGPWMTVRYESGGGDIHSRVWVRNGNGAVHLYELGGAGHLLGKWLMHEEDLRFLVSYGYNKSGERVSECLPSGLCRKFYYGKGVRAGELVKVEERPSNGAAPRITRIRMKMRHRLNQCGLPVEMTDEHGIVTTYEYFPTGDPDGNLSLVARLPADGLVAGRSSLEKESLLMGADNCGYLKSIRGDGATEFTYDILGNITSVTRPEGGVSRYFVNALNQVIREEHPGELPRRYLFDANDNLVKVAAGGDRRALVELSYDVLGRPVLVRRRVDSDTFIETRFDYDESGRIIGVEYPEGNRDEFEYDDEGRVLCEIRGAGSLERTKRCVRRDVDGNVVTVTDGDAAVTLYERNGFGEVIAVSDPAGNRKEYRRDASGRITLGRDVDANGGLLAESSIEYDADGNPVILKHRLWRDDPRSSNWVETRFGYDASGNLISVTKPPGGRMTIGRDGSGRVISITDPAHVIRRFIRDAAGRITESFIPDGEKRFRHVTRAYDDAGRVVEFNNGSKDPWRYAYDGFGNLTSVTNPYGNVTHFEVDDAGRVNSILQNLDGKNLVTKYEWDGNGRLRSVVDTGGSRTVFAYDALNRLILESFPDATEKRLAYDDADRVRGIIDRNKNIIRIGYDAAGRISFRHALAAGAATGDVHQRFEHDGMGRLVLAKDGNSEVRIAYDSLSRPIAERSERGWISRRYDDAGRVVMLKFPDGKIFYNTYDAGGRKKSVMHKGRRIASFEYDAAGNLSEKQLGSGLYRKTKRNNRGRISSIRYLRNIDVLVEAFETHRDEQGVVTADLGFGEVVRRYERDSLGRLTDVRDMDFHSPEAETYRRWHYDLDVMGNIRNVRHPERQRRIPQKAAQSHDIRTFDALARLIEVRRDGDVVADYRYDAFDRRTDFLWNGWQMVADGDSSYVYGDSTGAPIASVGDEGVEYLISDRLGSVRGVVDETGRSLNRCDYAPYGSRYKCEGIDVPFCFAGHICDDATGLIYMRYRYYDPERGSFITPDPLGYKLSHRSPSRMEIGPDISYHFMQGGASHATFPDRPLQASANYDVYPFDRIFFEEAMRFRPGEMNLYLYARADPSRFLDPLGLASLIFDRSDSLMYLLDGQDQIITQYLATNRAKNSGTDPFEIGGNGHFPNGTYSIGVPQFYSEEYREDLYRRFGLGDVMEGESPVTGMYWKRYEEDAPEYSAAYGRMRFRAGSAGGELDRIVWNRGLFIHGGRNDYRMGTLGCIRADDDELETLAANFIALRRQGDSVETITVRE